MSSIFGHFFSTRVQFHPLDFPLFNTVMSLEAIKVLPDFMSR